MNRTFGTILALLLIFFGLVLSGLVMVRIWQEMGTVAAPAVPAAAPAVPAAAPVVMPEPFYNEFGLLEGYAGDGVVALPLRRAAGTAGLCAEMDLGAPLYCYPSFLYDLTPAEQVQQMQNWNQGPGRWGWIIAQGQ